VGWGGVGVGWGGCLIISLSEAVEGIDKPEPCFRERGCGDWEEEEGSYPIASVKLRIRIMASMATLHFLSFFSHILPLLPSLSA
jgi:hypothetical protein